MSKIFLLLGHPDTTSYNGFIANSLEIALKKAGHEVRRQNIGDLKFDPILHHGYKRIQTTEPDIKKTQDNILWCNDWIILYPLWFGNVPALLKGLFDRTMLPGFAFHYHPDGKGWDKKLTGRTTHLISTCNAPSIFTRWIFGNSDFKVLQKGLFEFCGMRSGLSFRLNNIEHTSNDKRKAFAKQTVKKIIEALD